ncbi:VKGC carboxylase, partial [Chaetops frenatus]|nr:VKGC carboxylase [Chaetops frenatus]
LGEPLPAGVPLDPVVSLFLRREQREQRREQDSSLAQRLRRFLRRKFFLFRRRALRNLALGRPAPERLAQEVAFANWRGEEEEARPETDRGAQRGPEL